MPNIQIKDVPKEVHTELRVRAARAGKSLQEYLKGVLIREVQMADPAEYWERVRRQARESGVRMTFEEAADAVRELRGPIPPE